MTASLSGAVVKGPQLGSAGVIRRYVVRSSWRPAMLTTRPAYWQAVHRWQTRRGKHSRCLRSSDPPVQEKKCNPNTVRGKGDRHLLPERVLQVLRTKGACPPFPPLAARTEAEGDTDKAGAPSNRRPRPEGPPAAGAAGGGAAGRPAGCRAPVPAARTAATLRFVRTPTHNATVE
jgi:hypothetical protein